MYDIFDEWTLSKADNQRTAPQARLLEFCNLESEKVAYSENWIPSMVYKPDKIGWKRTNILACCI